jgi:hypothetical protein
MEGSESDLISRYHLGISLEEQIKLLNASVRTVLALKEIRTRSYRLI